MFRTRMTFNGKTITSGAQLGREMKKAATKALDDQIRRAATAGVSVTKTAKGYKLQGSQDGIERTLKKFGK